MDKQEILKHLGLDKAPPPRLEGLEDTPASGPAMLRYRKVLSLIDPIETAAFERYIPWGIEIDQSLDARVFHPEQTRAISIRSDVPIPVVGKITRTTGIGSAPVAHNHYLWLAQELLRHRDELGFVACAPPLIFRTNGAEGTQPLVGWITKVRYEVPDGQTRLDIGSNWGLLTQKNRTPEVHLEEGDDGTNVFKETYGSNVSAIESDSMRLPKN